MSHISLILLLLLLFATIICFCITLLRHPPGVEDPKICITTSRDPSSKLREFTKELRLIFPTSHRINRGNTKVAELVRTHIRQPLSRVFLFCIVVLVLVMIMMLMMTSTLMIVTATKVDTCRRSAFTDLIIVQEHRGIPVGLIVSHLPFGPTAHFAIVNPVLRHDLPERHTVSEAYPHLVFHNFETKLGQRVKSVLRFLFPVPKTESKRVMSFVNQKDYISFRHHTYVGETITPCTLWAELTWEAPDSASRLVSFDADSYSYNVEVRCGDAESGASHDQSNTNLDW